MLINWNKPLEYLSEEQRIVVEYRINKGYDAGMCERFGKTGLIAVIKGKHRMVIDAKGYDIFVPVF